MVRIAAIIFVIAAVTLTVMFMTRPKHGVGQTHISPAPEVITNADAGPEMMTNGAYPGRKPAPLGDVLTDAQDPEFVDRVLPGLRKFFATLDRAGVNPLKDKPLSFDKIKISYPPNGITCRFVMNDSWTATYTETPEFSGMMHFGERGADNPFRAISHANTNALIRLSQNAIQMPQSEAEQIINHVSDTLGVDRSRFEKPKIFPLKMLDYDLGMFTARYRLKGSDPLNQFNYRLQLSIRATSPTTAVLVSYLHGP